MFTKISVLLIFVICFCYSYTAQIYSHSDTVRGSITPERAWWNVLHYDLKVEPKFSDKSIVGQNIIRYEVIKSNDRMQIDLQKPLKIDSIVQEGENLSFTADENAYFITLRNQQNPGEQKQMVVYFSGKPKEAKNPPWDGGIVWTVDENNNPWIANANEGIGASVWWPLKDYFYDEPDEGMRITVITPKKMKNISNGQLINVLKMDSTIAWTWEVLNPINAYGVNLSIGDYVSWREKYRGKKGILNMDYYVLPYHEKQARKQFKQARKMMEAFEYWFGSYPFYEDGYKIIEVPYLGMEHQSSVTYGNHFSNGYLGKDLSDTGWGMKFDFIIIHESGHEWFGNSITVKDPADMWIHEGFTCYSESLFLEYYYGKKAGRSYVLGLRKNVLNDKPIIGNYEVNDKVSTDVYFKAANILHTLRTWLNDDKKWLHILRGLNKEFYHQTVTTQQIEDYISKESGLKLESFFNQYLRTTDLPKFDYELHDNTVRFRYQNVEKDFNLPLRIKINNKVENIHPTQEWQQIEWKKNIKNIEIPEDYYILVNK